MKHLGLGHILLLIGMGLLLGQAAADLTAYPNPIPSAEVGQMVTVTVSLTYNGQTPTQAVVTPVLPSGVVANEGGQSTQLYPGVMQQISYPLTAEQSGTYWIVSDITYAEEGTMRNLRLEAPFTATDLVVPEPKPDEQTPGAGPDGSNPRGKDPFPMPPDGNPPGGESPRDANPDNNGTGDGGFPENAPDQGGQPPGGENESF